MNTISFPSATPRAILLARCRAACARMGEEGGVYGMLNPTTAARYLAGMTQRMVRKWPEACTDRELERVALALEEQAARQVWALHAHAQAVTEAHRERTAA